MRMIALLGLVATATPALAQTPMNAAEFDAYATGKTITYAEGGQPYGIEQYLPGRRVRWAFVDDTCRIGNWYESEAGEICFVYEHDTAPQCWFFYDEANGLRAAFTGGGSSTILREIGQSTEPLACIGPDVGV
ncbi:MAG: hypothetical protein ACK5M4_06380 [Pseudorhodobacter sp.]